jgi:hypothetical protein
MYSATQIPVGPEHDEAEAVGSYDPPAFFIEAPGSKTSASSVEPLQGIFEPPGRFVMLIVR